MTRVLVTGKIKKSPIKDGVRWSLLNLFSTSSPREPERQSRTPASNHRGALRLGGRPAVPAACARSSSALALIAWYLLLD